jgi:predicted AAA+ superfamily ATPase
MGAGGGTPVDVSGLVEKAERILSQLQAFLPPAPPQTDWSARAFRWKRASGRAGYLQAVTNFARITVADLKGVDEQAAIVAKNTEQFVRGLPANNILLTGARGTGKSSLVRAMLHAYADEGLRLVEVEKTELVDLPDLVAQLAGRPERFIVFSDDLSFEADDPGYKVLKSTLDGSLASTGPNVLVYATSNRRHLMPEFMADNLQARHLDSGEIHPGESVEERISLSERFGLWVSFHPFTQDDYLRAVQHWLWCLGGEPQDNGQALLQQARSQALRFTLERGSRSGRVAQQFARHWTGLQGLQP